ncbi:MAG: BsuPI-related putative proteinase inhibitor [Balneolaceae bacterium]
MKKFFQYSMFLLVFPASVYLVSCDLIQSSSTDTATDSFITFTMHPKHLEWKDEVTVHHTGRIDFRRLEGEELPPATRTLDDNEFQHLVTVFENFHVFNNECYQFDENSVTLYSITWHGDEGEKNVVCDSSALARIDENKELRPLVFLLRDFRQSLVGEVRFEDKLSFTLQPDKTTYNLDEPVILQYRVTNITGDPVAIEFSSGCQSGFKIYHRDGEIVFSSNAFGCTGALTSWEIPPFSTEIREFEWDHGAYDGSIYQDRKVKSGTYTIVQFLRDGNSPYRSTEVTITEQGEGALQPRVVYNRFEDPSNFIYELNNRISESFSFDFSTDRKVGFQISEYDRDSQTAGEVVYTDTSGSPANSQINIEPFEEYAWNETWDRRDDAGNPVESGFYWAEMWLLGQEPELRTGRRVFIEN